MAATMLTTASGLHTSCTRPSNGVSSPAPFLTFPDASGSSTTGPWETRAKEYSNDTSLESPWEPPIQIAASQSSRATATSVSGNDENVDVGATQGDSANEPPHSAPETDQSSQQCVSRVLSSKVSHTNIIDHEVQDLRMPYSNNYASLTQRLPATENTCIENVHSQDSSIEADCVYSEAASKIDGTDLGIARPAQECPYHLAVTQEFVLEDFKQKHIYLFLDYDGTLTPIVSNPCNAVLSSRVRNLIFNLAADSLVTVGIVTGRALSSVKRFVQITATEDLHLIYAASHGFHIEAAGKKLHHRVGSRFIPVLKEAAWKVACAMGHIPGVALEDNEFAVSVHYRNAPENSEAEVEKVLDDILLEFPTLKKTRGKKVFELRINVVWDKGKAVQWLLETMGVDPHNDQNRIVYIGDDLTDEDAFRVVREFNKSLTVLVSDMPEHRPTAASCFVSTPEEVANFLEAVLCLRTSVKEPEKLSSSVTGVTPDAGSTLKNSPSDSRGAQLTTSVPFAVVAQTDAP